MLSLGHFLKLLSVVLMTVVCEAVFSDACSLVMCVCVVNGIWFMMMFNDKFESLCLVKCVTDTAFAFLQYVCDTGFSDVYVKKCYQMCEIYFIDTWLE